MAEIEYDFGEDDLEAFIVHHSRNAPTVRHTINRSRWILAGAFLIVAAALSVAASVSLAVGYAAIGVLIAIVWPRYSRGRWRRANLKHYRSAKNLATFGRTHLKLQDNCLISSNSFSTSSYKLEAVERVERSDSHAFIYVGALMALVVPRHKVHTGSFDQFLEELARHGFAAG